MFTARGTPFLVRLKEFVHARFLNIIKGTNCINPNNRKKSKFLKKFGFARKQLIEAGGATEDYQFVNNSLQLKR